MIGIPLKVGAGKGLTVSQGYSDTFGLLKGTLSNDATNACDAGKCGSTLPNRTTPNTAKCTASVS